MSIKIAVDNNFFDSFKRCSDAGVKQAIRSEFISRRFSFYPTIQLFSELLGLYNTGKERLLKEYSVLMLDMMHYRFFNEWNKIIRIELGCISDETIFLSEDFVNRIKETLRFLSKGKRTEHLEFLVNWVRANKQESYDFYKQSRTEASKLEGIKEFSKLSFSETLKLEAVSQWKEEQLKYIFSKLGKAISRKELISILSNPIKYPYLHTYFKLVIGLYRIHVLQQRKVDKGDSYDLRQLVYLTNLDYFVSDDDRLAELAGDVFGKLCKVIKFEQLSNLVHNPLSNRGRE